MTNPFDFEDAVRGRRVLVTGHTGFTGCWLSSWLATLECDVHGVALEPETEPSAFLSGQFEKAVHHHIVDIRNRSELNDIVGAIDPEIVFHLAAQPLVRRSFREPIETWDTNVMGTAHVLESMRHCPSTRAGVFVTTDKVYKNREWLWPYREPDEVFGKEPYSASKAAAEILIHSYQETLNDRPDSLAIASARGGNIIGGGDWSEDRLIPDIVRAITTDQTLVIRNPSAVRPWQHVAALCHGYLSLAARLLQNPGDGIGAWNFGPSTSDMQPVSALIDMMANYWKAPPLRIEPSPLAEAQLLMLDSSKASSLLQWSPPWTLSETIEKTTRWYRDFHEERIDAGSLIARQIDEYRTDLRDRTARIGAGAA